MHFSKILLSFGPILRLKLIVQRRIFNIISVPVFIVLYSFTAVCVVLVLLFSFLHIRILLKATLWLWSRTVFLLMGKRLKLIGKHNLEKGKKYIILANHSSMFDIMGIMAFFPGVSWFGKARLMKIPVFGLMLKQIDYIPMTISNIRNTKHMVEQLVKKSTARTIAIFPEGTRTVDGKLNPFYRGFIYLLKASETDILPVTLNGFYKLKPKNRFHINFRAKLEVIIHKPIDGKTLALKDDQMIITEVRDVIESAALAS